MTRAAEWVPLSEVRKSDWICEPSSGQPALVSEAVSQGDDVRVAFKTGPPGRVGYTGKADSTICRLVRVRGQKARKK